MINHILDLLVPLVLTILELSLKSSVIILFIILLKSIFGFRLQPQWHYTLWFILIIRLLIPFDVTTNYNFLDINSIMDTSIDRNTFAIHNAEEYPTIDENVILNQSIESMETIQNTAEPDNALNIMHIVVFVWLLGMIIFIAFLFRTYWMISHSLKNKRLVENKLTLQIFKDCRKRMKIQSNINLCESEHVKIPFL
ncbi:MAG: M56 family metallopeptidase, partial [Calditrichaceae bacterium]